MEEREKESANQRRVQFCATCRGTCTKRNMPKPKLNDKMQLDNDGGGTKRAQRGYFYLFYDGAFFVCVCVDCRQLSKMNSLNESIVSNAVFVKGIQTNAKIVETFN